MNFFPPILLAGWESWVVAVIVFILWAVGQAVEESKKKKKAAGQKPNAPQPAQALPPKPQQAAMEQPPHDRLREQVDEFLRRAGRKADEMGPGPKPQRARPAPPPQPVRADRDAMDIEVLEEEKKSLRPRQLVQPKRDGKRSSRQQSRLPDSSQPRHESVSEHVADHVGSRTFAERTSHLGEQVALADEKIESHLHQKFDRQLGSLSRSSATPAATAPPADSLATEIAAMLASPQGMRQAIVLSEILKRPEHW